VLQEVKIKDKKVVKGSKNLNGPGEADLALNEDDMDKAGKLTLAQLLEQKIKGYHSGYIRKSISLRHMVDDEPVFFVFDGVFINRFYNPSGEINGLYNYEQDYLNYYTAEDIKGIEVMSSAGYSTSYIIDFISPRATGASVAFIEITTRSGHGPFMNKTQGTYLYKPLAATLPKQFYRPRYKVKTPVTGADLRSTIHWQPDIITDTAGNATVSFYCADKAAHYTIIIQGIDLNGSLGFKREGIIVK
jgi:hypothetical protein